MEMLNLQISKLPLENCFGGVALQDMNGSNMGMRLLRTLVKFVQIVVSLVWQKPIQKWQLRSIQHLTVKLNPQTYPLEPEKGFGSNVPMILRTFGSQLVTISKGRPDLTFVQTAVENVNDWNYPVHRFSRLYRRPITQEETSA